MRSRKSPTVSDHTKLGVKADEGAKQQFVYFVYSTESQTGLEVLRIAKIS